MSEIHGHDAGDLRKYRTEIPNIVFTLGLDAYALALYCHLKRTTGAADGGLCWKSTRTLANETRMSIGKVSEARSVLELPLDVLGGKSLITVHRPKAKGKATTVVCNNIWPENFGGFAPCSCGEHACSCGEPKNKPLEEVVVSSLELTSGIEDKSPDSANVIGLEKHVVDKLYSAFDKAGYTLDNSDYGYHLGRAKKMLEKMNPTDEELDAIATASVEHFEVYSKTDAMSALRYMRQQAARAKRLNPEQQPHWSKATNTDKPRAALWYASTQDVTFEQAEEWIKSGMTHSAIMDRIKGGVA